MNTVMSKIVWCFLVVCYVHFRAQAKSCSGGFLVWDNNLKTCSPSEVCHNVALNQIPDLSGHLPVSMMCNADSVNNAPTLSNLYDRSAARDCLRNKKLCVLGDSTIEESIHDIVVLLSGIGDDPNRVKYYYDSMIRALHPIKFNIGDVELNLSGSGRSGDRAHRLMHITVPAINFSLYHHFTGHKLIEANGEGITALVYRLENLYTSELSNCDILLMNSAAHDFQSEAYNPDCQHYPPPANGTCLQYYMSNVTALHRLVDKLYHNKTNISVFWKGDAYSAGIGGFIHNRIKMELEERVAYAFRHSTAAEKGHTIRPVQFINITGPLAELPFTMKHASFHHIGQHSNREQSDMPLLWSSVSTQVIMNNICGRRR